MPCRPFSTDNRRYYIGLIERLYTKDRNVGARNQMRAICLILSNSARCTAMAMLVMKMESSRKRFKNIVNALKDIVTHYGTP